MQAVAKVQTHGLDGCNAIRAGTCEIPLGGNSQKWL